MTFHLYPRFLLLASGLFQLMPVTLRAQGPNEGISFFNGNWKDVIAESKNTGKLVFVDVYTTWCLPCRKMEKEIFPLPAVGMKYNSAFINYRVDAEKGEGKFINEKYSVDAYPTYLFVNGDGVLIYAGIGYDPDPDKFTSLADTALYRATNKLTIDDLGKMYRSGNRNKEFVRSFIRKLAELNMNKQLVEVVDQYITSLSEKEKREPANLNFILRYLRSADSKAFDFVLNNQDVFLDEVMDDSTLYPDMTGNSKEAKLGTILGNLITKSVVDAIEKRDKGLLNSTVAKAGSIHNVSLKFPYTLFSFRLQFYATTKDTASILKETGPFLNKVMVLDATYLKQQDSLTYASLMSGYLSGREDSTKVKDFQSRKAAFATSFSRYVANTLELGARRYYTFATAKQDLEKAIPWSKRALEIGGNEPRYLNALARLYYKSGKRKKAIKWQQEAVRHASPKEAAGQQKDLDLMRSKAPLP